jgi:hypothetical protein
MMQQDPAAFREMVEAGLRLLTNRTTHPEKTPVVPERVAQGFSPEKSLDQNLTKAYGEFEKAANADLEKSIGGAISHLMEEALPNLRLAGTGSREGTQVQRPFAIVSLWRCAMK